MKRFLLISMALCSLQAAIAHDWDDVPVPAPAGDGLHWVLQDSLSDSFDYEFAATSTGTYINDKWWNFWHNPWDGPGPTQWKHENVYVTDGHLHIKASRNGDTKTFTQGGTSHTLTATQMGCMISKRYVQYPVFVEARVQIADAVFANNVWMINDTDYEEIDICENYGGLGDPGRTGTADNSWFAKHIHLSHHMFYDRGGPNYYDYQPRDEEGVYGTWYYENGRTDWTDGYTDIGVFWEDPYTLHYYINGNWVRTLEDSSYSYLNSAGSQINQTANFRIVDKYDFTNGAGITDSMKLILNIECQDWNAVAGRHPTDDEINGRPDDHIMKIDWIRVFKPEIPGATYEISENTELTITPNPFNDQLLVKANVTLKHIALFDVAGTQIQSHDVYDLSYPLNTTDLNPGMYILQVQTQDGQWSTQKVIKM